MPTKTIPWDTASLLRDEDDAVEYLNAVLDEAAETNDVSAIAHALGVVARARGMSQLAKETGMSRESLYKSLSADGNPNFLTVSRVLRAMGARLKIEREKADA